MSINEKYDSFSIKKIVFYDDIEKNKFMNEFKEKYKGHILKVDNNRIKGSGKLGLYTKEEKNKLDYLNISIQTNQDNTTKITGYGHRRAIFPIEMIIKKAFDKGIIISYTARDSLNRLDDTSELRELINEEKSFSTLCKQRLTEWKEGTFPNPRDKKN